MSRALITGASGFVGRHLVRALAARGWTSIAVSREPRPARDAGQITVALDPERIADWTESLAAAEFVVHLAARVHVMRERSVDPLSEFRRANVDFTRELAAAAAAAGVKRFLLVSTVKVNGEATVRGAFRETDPPRPEDAYAISKHEAEVALRAVCETTPMEFVIIRPPLVYGPEVGGNFLRLLNQLDRGLPLPLANVENRRSMIGVDNLCDAIVTCLLEPAAGNELFLVSDGRDLSTPELVRELARGLGRGPRLLPVPTGLLAWLAGKGLFQREIRRLTGSLQVDMSKIRECTGWVPPHTCTAQLRATADWYLGQRARAR